MAIKTYAELLAIAATGPIGQEYQTGIVERSQLEDQLLQAQINAITGNKPLECIVLTDEKSSGTQGGSFLSGARRVRELNTIYKYPASLTWGSLSANQITITLPGTYLVIGEAPAREVYRNRVQLRNVTDLLDEPGLHGNGYSSAIYNAESRAAIIGLLTLSAAPKTYQLEHECESTRLDIGFGTNTAFGDTEIYSKILFGKLL